jgi:predicted transcriptional regulator
MDDPLETALDQMRSHQVHSLYVVGENPEEVVGVLAYSDIVGLLYQYCHRCEYSKMGPKRSKTGSSGVQRFRTKDVMSPSVTSFNADASLAEIIEGLSMHQFGAVLITDENNDPCGVVSKTDLMLAFKHGISTDAAARTIMSKKLISCNADDFLETSIKKMIFAEVQRLFVYGKDPAGMVGVLSLSDAARIRSGSCHACISSRIRVDKQR